MSLYDALSQIAEQVKEQRQWMTNEEATKQVSIRPFIHALGYNTYDLGEVQPEFVADPRQRGNERVDFVIKMNGKSIILVEAKSADTKLTENHWRQLHNYFAAVEVKFGILTDGIEYLFYADFDKQNVMDKQPFLTVDLLNLDKRKVEVLEGFTKTRFDPMKSIRYLKLRERVEQELNQPSDWLVKHFIWDIHDGHKWKSVIEAYRPLLKRAIDEYVIEQRSVQPVIDPPPPTSPDFIPVFGYYNGRRFEAELRLESVRRGIYLGSKSIRYKGVLMKSSHAMWVAIRDVFPEFNSDIWNSQKMNSWTFWRIIDPLDGSERHLRLIAGFKRLRDDQLYDRIVNS